jgi:hypothetical protein
MVELRKLKEQAQEDSAARQHLEGKLKQSQRDLCAAQMRIDQFQQQKVKLSLVVRSGRRVPSFSIWQRFRRIGCNSSDRTGGQQGFGLEPVRSGAMRSRWAFIASVLRPLFNHIIDISSTASEASA